MADVCAWEGTGLELLQKWTSWRGFDVHEECTGSGTRDSHKMASVVMLLQPGANGGPQCTVVVLLPW